MIERRLYAAELLRLALFSVKLLIYVKGALLIDVTHQHFKSFVVLAFVVPVFRQLIGRVVLDSLMSQHCLHVLIVFRDGVFFVFQPMVLCLAIAFLFRFDFLHHGMMALFVGLAFLIPFYYKIGHVESVECQFFLTVIIFLGRSSWTFGGDDVLHLGDLRSFA